MQERKQVGEVSSTQGAHQGLSLRCCAAYKQVRRRPGDHKVQALHMAFVQAEQTGDAAVLPSLLAVQ